MNSITKRWVRGSLLITVLILLFAEGMFWYFSVHSYYEAATQTMFARLQTMVTQLSVIDVATPKSRELVLRRMVEQFEEKDTFNLMLLDNQGQVLISSTGFHEKENQVNKTDFAQALSHPKGIGQAVYQTANREHVMALTMLLPFASGEIRAIRLMTSLSLVDRVLSFLIIISLSVVIVVLGFTIWSGMFFIRSIVWPIGEIEAGAAQIAKGHLDVRINNHYNDEVGQLADAINRMASNLAQNERMKNDFISSVSHELRTPLTSIKGWVETIGNVKQKDAVYQRGIQVIASETDRLYAMVEELLDFSTMQNGIVLKSEMLDLVAEMSEAVLIVEQRAFQQEVMICWQEPMQAVPVYADAGRLRQVFVNLLDNALKYSPPKGKIKIELLQDEKNIFIGITDEGPGIAPEDLEHVKTKFYKGTGAKRGSGIGLAVVDEIITAHGGDVVIQSELGVGTTIFVRLPQAAESAGKGAGYE